MSLSRSIKFQLGLGAGLGVGWIVAQHVWLFRMLSKIDVRQSLAKHVNQAPRGFRLAAEAETETYSMRHTIEDGIERIAYTPKQRRHQTPILMQHGMWHGAWCWESWQKLLAEWGWESVAVSLPGHSGSPRQRRIELCTLDYYLGFLKAEVDRLPRPPILMGHSMGGALTQWYLKYVGDLPAAVLVAPWVADSPIRDNLIGMLKKDPLLFPLSSLAWNAAPWVRSPQRAARLLITEGAIVTPEELHARLGPESQVVVYQHNPPFWYPPQKVNTPLLWLTGECDATITVKGATRSAAFYYADHVIVPEAGHNLMMEKSYRQTAEKIRDWLAARGVEYRRSFDKMTR